MFTDKELAKLISEVETEFSSFLAKAEEVSLAKSEDESDKADKKDDEKPEAKESEEAPASDDAPAADEAAEAAPAEDKEEAPAAPADEAAPEAPVQDEGHGYDDEDMAHMDQMYASMSRAELIAHHDAVKRALDAMGMQDPAAEQAAAPAAPEMDKCGDMTMQKSEEDTVVEVKPEVLVASAETELLKSELAAKDGQIEELKKSVEVMTTFINKLFEKKSAPQGKAITSLETIQKSENGNSEEDLTNLSKGEITARLTKKASDPTLKKSDREAINQFYATGAININGISHLLK